MRDITVIIASDGTAQVTEPTCFSGEHNAARLCITLNTELASSEYSYCLLSFDVYGLGRRIISNIIEDETSSPAYRQNNVIYCPLPEALTTTGELSVQVEAHRRQGTETVKVFKSEVFTLRFEPSISGCDEELEEKCGILPQLTAAIARMLEFEEFSGGEDGVTFTPTVSADGVLSWSNDGGLENPAAVNIKGAKGEKGDKGDKGDTGANGTDYILTDSDKSEIADLIGTAVVPDYWLEELEEKADAIQQAMEAAGRNKSAFLWYTDSHWVNGNSKISPKLLNYLYMNTPMNKVNFGGDIIGDSLLATRDEMKYLYEWRKAIRNLPNHHSVFGNHDMYDSSSVEYENDNYRYAFLLAPEETADMVCGDGNYYYIDNQTEKTRYLFLAYLSSDLAAMLAQGEFICDSIISVPEGWHIVAIAHRWWQYTSSSNPTAGVIPAYETEILQIFDEYNARKSHSASNYFTSQNFSDSKGKVEFCIGGHLHVDYDFKSDGGIPVIITAPDTNQERVPDSTVDCGTTGTITESAVFGIIADYNEDVTKITVVGVGRGTSRVVRASTVVPISISDISYGGDTTVDSAIDKSKFSFTVNYSDGTASSVTGANTVTPATIGAVGDNSVTITYEEDGTTLTGTVTIVGTEKLVVNLFDKNDADVLLTGRFNSSHNTVAYAEGQLCTGYIEAELGDVFTLTSDKSHKTNGYTGVVQMYDSNKTYIGGYNNETVNWTWSSDCLTGSVEVDSSLSSTAYVRFCVAYTDINSIVITKS